MPAIAPVERSLLFALEDARFLLSKVYPELHSSQAVAMFIFADLVHIS